MLEQRGLGASLGRHPVILLPKNRRRIESWSGQGAIAGVAIADIEKARRDFKFFRKLVLGWETYPHQSHWIDLLNTNDDSFIGTDKNKIPSLKGIAGQDLLILAPRGSTKSTVLAEWVSWVLGTHVGHGIALKIIYISFEVGIAAEKSRRIQQIIQTPEYQQVFPWIRLSKDKHGEREWQIDFKHAGLPTTQEQYTLVCAGLKGAITSRRAHLIVLDDLIKSPSDIQSASVRDRMISNWESCVKFTRYEGSRAVCLGTRMRGDDIYCTTFLSNPKDPLDPNAWKVVEQSALLTAENGDEYSYCPRLISTVSLQLERQKEPVTFSFQRQNKLVIIETTSIAPSLIKRGLLPAKFNKLVLGVDLSAGLKESNDYTAMVLGGEYQVGDRIEYWIIDAWEERITGNTAKLDAMIEIWEYWKYLLPQVEKLNPDTGGWEEDAVIGLKLWFDSSALGLSLRGDYEDHIIGRKNILNWTIQPVPASGRGDKLTRLRKHSGLFENDLVRFNLFGRPASDSRQPLSRAIEQITNFGVTSHDDLADALELCLSGLRFGGGAISKGNY